MRSGGTIAFFMSIVNVMGNFQFYASSQKLCRYIYYAASISKVAMANN